MKTTWRFLFAFALLPVGSAAQAAGYLDGSMRSPASFDEALGIGQVKQVSMLEPEPAEPTAAAASTAAASSCCGSIGDCCGDSCADPCCGDLCNACCGPTWTVRTGAVILERARPRRQRVIEDRTGGTAGDGFTDIFDFGFEGGPDITITRWLRNGNGIEVRYFGALDWNDQATWTSANGWAIPTNPPRMGVGVANIDANYRSSLDSTEINYRQAPNQSISYLVGFRWIELSEDLDVNANFGSNQATVGWDTNNHLYGAQTGAEVNLFDRGGPFTALAWFKGGLFGNDADNNFSLVQAVGPDVEFTDETGRLAFVGDIAFTGSYQLTNNMALRSGYQLLFIDGVALASEQIFATNVLTGQGVDPSGFAFYHGAMLSLDFVW